METEEIKIKRIKYADAAEFVDALFEQKIAEVFDFYCGGIFHAEPIQNWINRGNLSGIMFWFGLENTGNKPFLAFERKNPRFVFSEDDLGNYRPNRPWVHQTGLRLVEDIENIASLNNPDPGQTRLQAIKYHLEKEGLKPTKDFKRRDSSNIMEMCTNFKTHLLKKDITTVGFTYFSFSEDAGLTVNGTTKKHWNWFFEQGDVHYIRYYFGYNKEKKGHPLCLILIPVNKDGQNFSKNDLRTGISGVLEEEPLLLEFSWPPKNP